MRLVAVVLVPITAAYVVLGRPIAVTLFEWGNYTHAEASSPAPVIAVAGLGLVPYAIMQLQNFAFYALRDTRTPALINIPVVAFRIAVDAGRARGAGGAVGRGVADGRQRVVVRGRHGARARSCSAGGWAASASHGRRSRWSDWLARPSSPPFRRSFWGFGSPDKFGDGKLASALQLAVCGGVLLSAYIGATLLLRVSEARELALMVRRRLVRAG